MTKSVVRIDKITRELMDEKNELLKNTIPLFSEMETQEKVNLLVRYAVNTISKIKDAITRILTGYIVTFSLVEA